jgi:hypothetical protein
MNKRLRVKALKNQRVAALYHSTMCRSIFALCKISKLYRERKHTITQHGLKTKLIMRIVSYLIFKKCLDRIPRNLL